MRRSKTTGRWSNIVSGKWKDHSIAEVALRDPDYLFWAREDGWLQRWAVRRYEEVCTKASRIRIPPIDDVAQVVDYTFEPGRGSRSAAPRTRSRPEWILCRGST